MFIGIVGPRCSGKHTIAETLIQDYGFQMLRLESSPHEDRPCHDNALSFPTFDTLLSHVTERWRENFVTCDIDAPCLESAQKRPFFLLVSVNAPISLRFQRYLGTSKEIMSMEKFVQVDDAVMFYPQNDSASLHSIMATADVCITNTSINTSAFREQLLKLDLTNPERLRPSWDTYFMHLSDLAARRSNCMKRRVGCILVKDSRIVATGYNGTPRGLRNCNEGGCGRCNGNAPCGMGLDRCLCMHAEENALLEAGRSRVDFGHGVVLYCNTCPCLGKYEKGGGCAIKIVQIGVKEVVYSRSYGMDEMTEKPNEVMSFTAFSKDDANVLSR
ncbi:deoxycytidylate deaminase [Lichtheimia corymbifera JMRC:FSU:9682]|uniref:Deoxycytidylate deaminase n=1 Tax=Lichtheimia corymbifera JMRC:FSU:9682 TaxID=1263082 RepID=A0A068RNW7_9FUNG|nr:deoxycytidylate deaminase [Lichtheimia corymbifera JMRC:FSU:9682]